MFFFALLIAVAFGAGVAIKDIAPGATNDVYTFDSKCMTKATKGGNHDACNYDATNRYTDKVFHVDDILYDREKCTTCCRVLFVSEYNFRTGKAFTEADDKDVANNIRFTMDLEFEYKEFVRNAVSNYEQCILARPLQGGKSNQYWEFAPYMMYISYNIPQRVHDIRSSATATHRLIIWKKKPPLDAGTNNQRFIYIHPYANDYYPDDENSLYNRGKPYKKHFFVPFQSPAKLCYEVKESNVKGKNTGLAYNIHTWTGNVNYNFTKSQAIQIIAQTCTDKTTDDNYPRQLWVPVFA